MKRARDRSQAPGSQGAAFRNAGPLGEARTRRSRGARRLGGVEAAVASGETIGRRRYLDLPPLSAGTLRLRVERSLDEPRIASFRAV